MKTLCPVSMLLNTLSLLIAASTSSASDVDGGNSKVMNRIIEIQKLNAEEQKTVFTFLDAFLRDTKTRKAYAA
jgi:hypothetical protein